MNGLALLIPIALVFGLGALFLFHWALGNGQFEDPEGAALRILLDDDMTLDEQPTEPAGHSKP